MFSRASQHLGVGRDDNRSTAQLSQVVEQRQNEFGRDGIQDARRLVGKDKLRFSHECASQCDALLFATRKFSWTMRSSVLKSNLLQRAPR